MAREELQSLLGQPDMISSQKRNDKNPTLLKYGDVEFYFISSEDNRLCTIFLDHFDVPKGNQKLRLDPWILKGGLSRPEAESGLTDAGITFRVVALPDSTMEGIVTSAGIELGFCKNSDNEYEPPAGLYSICRSLLDEMVTHQPTKQISITIPEEEYIKIRREAVRRRRKISKLCSEWVIKKAATLPEE
ncbi:MAG TPA: hypothetical protein VFD58_17730 [Blastocatellia bacterium]|nr:hypothetical protein [Blastocatellia bacterium]